MKTKRYIAGLGRAIRFHLDYAFRAESKTKGDFADPRPFQEEPEQTSHTDDSCLNSDSSDPNSRAAYVPSWGPCGRFCNIWTDKWQRVPIQRDHFHSGNGYDCERRRRWNQSDLQPQERHAHDNYGNSKRSNGTGLFGSSSTSCYSGRIECG